MTELARKLKSAAKNSRGKLSQMILGGTPARKPAKPKVKPQAAPAKQAPIQFPATIAARVLAKAKSPQLYRFARKLIMIKIGIACTNHDKANQAVNCTFLKETFAKTGAWIRKAASIAKVDLPLDILEQSVYAEMQNETGLTFRNMAGLINKRKNATANASYIITITPKDYYSTETEENLRLASKFAKKLAGGNRKEHSRKAQATRNARHNATKPNATA